MDAQQRADVISTARKMIVKMGVKSFRMDDIVQSHRISKRTLYETFGDKEELIFLAVQEHFEEFNSSNAKAAENAPNILVAMLIIMEEIRKNAEVNWQLRSSLKRYYPQINKRLWLDKADVKRKIVAASLQKGVEDGYIQNRINIALTMNIFSYIAIGISENNEIIEIPSDISIEEAFQEVLVNYMRGISTIKGIEAIEEYLATKNKQA